MAYMIQGPDGNLYGPADQQTVAQWAREGRIQRVSVIQDQATGVFAAAETLPFLIGFWRSQILPQPLVYQQQYYPAPSAYYPLAKSKLGAAALAFFLGMFGAHNFYLGHSGRATAQLVLTLLAFPLIFAMGLGVLLLLGVRIWSFIEFIMILCGAINDVNGCPLQN